MQTKIESIRGCFSHTTPDVRWLCPSKYEYLHTYHNRKFWYTTSTGLIVRPPEHFIFDFGSVPLFMTRMFPRDEFGPAYLIHDTLCKFAKLTPNGIDVTFDDANWILFDAIDALCFQVPELKWRVWKRYPVYAGVTLGGWWPWNKHNDGRQKCFPYFP